ncbi:hypothetical protein lacNasYZ02_01550 [Lactobacillus nasalidis]|nr:hypothetical protein lacNasYZ02_01550 [Lactobacillus nasalidis]
MLAPLKLALNFVSRGFFVAFFWKKLPSLHTCYNVKPGAEAGTSAPSCLTVLFNRVSRGGRDEDLYGHIMAAIVSRVGCHDGSQLAQGKGRAD